MRMAEMVVCLTVLAPLSCSRATRRAPDGGPAAPSGSSGPAGFCPPGTRYFETKGIEQGCLLGTRNHGPLRMYNDDGSLFASIVYRDGVPVRTRYFDKATGRLVLQKERDAVQDRSRVRHWKSADARGTPPYLEQDEFGGEKHGLKIYPKEYAACYDRGNRVWFTRAPPWPPCPQQADVEWETGLPEGEDDYTAVDGGM
ncbi:MAG: hypothetical protein IT370_14165 [Deltaproteobacteria bacterium]|nr:hypothetical protein [Deltaproteobacteria bacterium]